MLRTKGFTGSASEIDAVVIAHPDTIGLAEFLNDFTGLTDDQKKKLLIVMQVSGARAVKGFKAEFTSNEAPFSQEFLQALIGKYERRLATLP